MQHTDFNDETLMAFADGELDDPTSARIARALADDPALAARVEMFRAARKRVADAIKPLATEAVPTGLAQSVAAMIERDRLARTAAAPSTEHEQAAGDPVVVPFRQRTAPPRSMPGWLMPIAAAFVLMVGGSGGYFLGSSLQAPVPVEFASLDDPGIIQALSEIPSGKAMDEPGTGRTIEPVVSFQLEDGTLCREYKLTAPKAEGVPKGVVSIACHEQNRWKTHLLMASTRPDEGFVPAGSAETIDAYLSSIHAGSPLDGDAEDAALKSIRR